MLQQIIESMYVDPDLLSELSDEQKAILFVKIREEQVKRWKEKEEKLEQDERKKPRKPPKPGKKRVGFLKGSDGKDWVWVMGDHRDDKSVEQILEEEAQAEALQEAEMEAEKFRLEEETLLKKTMEEEEKRLEKEKAAKEAELRRKEEEAALYQSLKEARLAAQKLEEERKRAEEEDKRHIAHLRRRFNAEKRKSFEKVEENVHRRSSEIYIRWKEMRQHMEKMAEESSKEVEENWKQQEKKAKVAQNQLKELARNARLEHKESLRRSGNVLSAISAFNKTKEEKPPLPPKNMTKIRESSLVKRKAPRPPRPPNKEAVVQWFKEEEKNQGAGTDPATGKVARWFHGVISRLDAENILIKKSVGSYLVRVSERVWGYTISYRAEDRCKHFLIDRSEEGYQFFGTNQVQHSTLADLVNFHMNNPITRAGQEMLQTPCGQESDPPDYLPLFNLITESTDL